MRLSSYEVLKLQNLAIYAIFRGTVPRSWETRSNRDLTSWWEPTAWPCQIPTESTLYGTQENYLKMLPKCVLFTFGNTHDNDLCIAPHLASCSNAKSHGSKTTGVRLVYCATSMRRNQWMIV